MYCGGTWQGIIQQLDYIQGMGFSAVSLVPRAVDTPTESVTRQIWISPVVYQVNGTENGEGYHGYWAQDLYGVNPNFGQPSDLVALSDELHERDMYLMVDVVPNNMAYEGDASQIDYSVFNPFNDERYFHPPCVADYSNQSSVEVCSQSTSANALPDLATEDPNVSNMLTTWISELVANYSIDGLRLDAANHMAPDFLRTVQDSAGVFIAGEVYNGDPGYACTYQGSMDALLDFPLYFPLARAFNSTGGDMGSLVQMMTYIKELCSDTSMLGAFVENHDLPRFASWTSDMALAENVLTFAFLSDNFPILYYGQEQHYAGGESPADREAMWTSDYNTDAPLYQYVALLNQIRSEIATFSDTGFLSCQQRVIYNDTSVIGLQKGSEGKQMIVVLNHQGSAGGRYTLNVPNTGLNSSGSSSGITELVACTTQTVQSDGSIDVAMNAGAPKVYYLTDLLQGSGLCGL